MGSCLSKQGRRKESVGENYRPYNTLQSNQTEHVSFVSNFPRRSM